MKYRFELEEFDFKELKHLAERDTANWQEFSEAHPEALWAKTEYYRMMRILSRISNCNKEIIENE